MKKILLFFLFINLQTSMAIEAKNNDSCELKDFVLINASGTVDWDPEKKELATMYPEIDVLTPDLPDLVSTKLKIGRDCKTEGLEIELKIFAYRAPKRLVGGDDSHESHGQAPPGVWVKEPVVMHTQKLKSGVSLVEFEKINLAAVWAMPSEFFWFWSLRFEFSLRKGEEQITQFSKEVGAPLSH